MHDSFAPLGGLVPMWLMQIGEVVFGGVGSGLYGMLVFAVLAVFIAGLMVGRTPEYVGKKGGVNAYPWPAFCRLSGRNRRNRGRAYLLPRDCLVADRGAPQALSFSLGVAPWHVARNPLFLSQASQRGHLFCPHKAGSSGPA
jgi:hypothetical protein